MKNQREQQLVSLLGWFEANGYKGYDPYDFKCLNNLTRNIYHQHLGLGFVGKALSYGLFEILDWHFPGTVRKVLGINPKEHANALSHFAIAYLILADRFQDEAYLAKHQAITNHIWDTRQEVNALPFWGLPFTWGVGERKFTPKTALTVSTLWVGESFLLGYQITKDPTFLDRADRIGKTLISLTGYTEISTNEICFHYSNKSVDRINNANLLAAEYIASLGLQTENAQLLDLANKAANYSINTALPNGTLPYQVHLNGTKAVANDLYHAGYEARSILLLGKHLNREDFVLFANNYYSKIKQQYLDIAALRFSRNNIERKPYNSDTTALAELLSLQTVFQDDDDSIQDLIDTSVSRYQNNDGSFIYQEKGNSLNRFPFIRWSQGWMAYGLAKSLA